MNGEIDITGIYESYESREECFDWINMSKDISYDSSMAKAREVCSTSNSKLCCLNLYLLTVKVIYWVCAKVLNN